MWLNAAQTERYDVIVCVFSCFFFCIPVFTGWDAVGSAGARLKDLRMDLNGADDPQTFF